MCINLNQYNIYCMLQLLITFIWFGATIPEDYMIKLGEITYPYQLLMNPFFNTTLKLDIQKSDRYRLEYLRHGGIYSDIDNTIKNYTCLMQKLTNFDGEMAVSEYNNVDANGTTPNNNFIYVPLNRTTLINEILEQNPEYNSFCDSTVLSCNGPSLYYRYRDRITILNLSQCMYHTNQYSWWKDSNIILNQTKAPPLIIQEKMVKKKFYVDKMNENKQENELLQKKLAQLQNQLNLAKKKLELSINNFMKNITTSFLQQFNQNLSKVRQNILIQSNRSIEILLKKFEELKKQKSQNNFKANLVDELLLAQENKFSQQTIVLEQILMHAYIFGVLLVVMLIIVFVCFRKNQKSSRPKKELIEGRQEIVIGE